MASERSYVFERFPAGAEVFPRAKSQVSCADFVPDACICGILANAAGVTIPRCPLDTFRFCYALSFLKFVNISLSKNKSYMIIAREGLLRLFRHWMGCQEVLNLTRKDAKASSSH